MTETRKAFRELQTFNQNWDNYTPTERDVIIKDFQTRFYELGEEKIDL